MSNIPQTALTFIHWQIDKIPSDKWGLQHLISTQCGADEKSKNGQFPFAIRCRYQIFDGQVNIFSCLAEKIFNLYDIRNLIDVHLILKLVIETNLGFDIDFNIKKVGTEIEFAQLPIRDNREFVEDVKVMVLKLVDLSKGLE